MTFNKKIISRNFSKKAQDYNNFAKIQKRSAEILLTNFSKIIDLKNCNNLIIADLGCASQSIASLLNQFKISKNNQIFNLDLSFEMLKNIPQDQKNNYLIQGDIENLPFKNSYCDLIISSFALHWLNDLNQGFFEISRSLKNLGYFIFCLPIFPSLSSLKKIPFLKINDFPSKYQIIKIINQNNFKILNHFEENFTEKYHNSLSAIKSIKQIGANYSQPLKKNDYKHFKNIKALIKNNLQNCHQEFNLDWQIIYFFVQKND